MPKRSTTANITDFSTFVLEAFELQQQVDVIYVDFAKAFNTIIDKNTLILFLLS